MLHKDNFWPGFTVLLLFCSCWSLSAETIPLPSYNNWRSGNLWGGGYVQNVVLCPSDPRRCYAYIDMAGLYRSDDRGMTWQMLHGNFPLDAGIEVRGVSVSPDNADEILTVLSSKAPWSPSTPGVVYRSEDGGKNFTPVCRVNVNNIGTKASGFIIDRKPGAPEVVILGTYQGVMQSLDRGKTWQNIYPQALNPSDLRYDRANPDRIWLCSPEYVYGPKTGGFFLNYERGLFRSEDGGKNWKKLSPESPTELFQDPGDPGRLFGLFGEKRVKLSFDGGQSWQDFSKGLELNDGPSPDNWCLQNRYTAIGGSTDFIVTASTLRTFYILKKGSDTWQKIDIQSVDPGNYMGAQNINHDFGKATGSITVDPVDPQHWYATDYYNVLQTFDGGRNWRCTSDGISPLVIQNVVKMPDKHQFMVSMMDHTWYYSADGGKTFKPYPVYGWERKFIVFSPLDHRIVYASGPRAGMVTVSTDGGISWRTPAQNGLPQQHNYFYKTAIAPDRLTPQKVYVAVANEFADGKGGGVYVSEDSGENWQRMSEGLPELGAYHGKSFFENTPWCGNELAVADDGTPVCISLVYNYAFYYDRNAKCWKESRHDSLSPWGLKDLKADPFSNRVWLAAGQKGLLYSDDSGRTWQNDQNFPGKTAGQISIDYEQKGRFSISTPQGLYLTEDGGKTWLFCNLERILPGASSFMPVAFDGDQLLLGTPNSGVFYMTLQRKPDGTIENFVKQNPKCETYTLADIRTLQGNGNAELLPDGGKIAVGGKNPTPIPENRKFSSIKLETIQATNYLTLGTRVFQLPPKSRWKIFFEARGNIKLTVYTHGKNRKDVFTNLPLREQYQSYAAEINVPQDDSWLGVYFLNWQQAGWFEIRKLVLEKLP